MPNLANSKSVETLIRIKESTSKSKIIVKKNLID
jgi:hypothetical protein